MAVIKADTSSIKIKIDRYNGYYNAEQFDVYAEKIPSVDRKISEVERDELFLLFSKLFTDRVSPKNYIIAEDGVYIIDTAFTNIHLQDFYR